MEDQVLKLELSALFLVDGREHSIEHYQRRIAQVYQHHCSLDKVKDIYDKLIEMLNETEMNIALIEQGDNLPVYPDQWYEGN